MKTGQLLRHYSPDLEVFRVLGATSGSTRGRMVEGGELLNLVEMARYVTRLTTSYEINFSQPCFQHTWLLVQHSLVEFAEGCWAQRCGRRYCTVLVRLPGLLSPVIVIACFGYCTPDAISSNSRFSNGLSRRDRFAHRTSVVIDFSGQLKQLEEYALTYADLSVEGNTDKAAEGLFRALRWAETRPSAQRLLIAGAFCQSPQRLLEFLPLHSFQTQVLRLAPLKYSKILLFIKIYRRHTSRQSRSCGFERSAGLTVLGCEARNQCHQLNTNRSRF